MTTRNIIPSLHTLALLLHIHGRTISLDKTVKASDVQKVLEQTNTITCTILYLPQVPIPREMDKFTYEDCS